MAKVQLKPDTIKPFGGLFSFFRQFDPYGMHSPIEHPIYSLLERTSAPLRGRHLPTHREHHDEKGAEGV